LIRVGANVLELSVVGGNVAADAVEQFSVELFVAFAAGLWVGIFD